MKIATPNHENTGNVKFIDEVESTLDPHSINMILDMLAKKYNSPYTAALREYVSNAADSHKEAGVSKPVLVSLPTAFAPTLTVRDFGLGLDSSEIMKVYAHFGASTKRDSDEAIGGFGIGSKSAFAIADQFQVVSVKNGLKNAILAHRDEGKILFSFIAKDEPTKDENGVLVSIPISRVDSYSTEEVRHVLGGWKRSEVEVVNNDLANVRVADKWIETEFGFINPELFEGFVKQRHSTPANGDADRWVASAMNVLVGPVLYPVSRTAQNAIVWNRRIVPQNIAYNIVPRIAIADVVVAQSREVLEDTDRNEAAISEAYANLYKEVSRLAIEKVRTAKTMKDAIFISRISAVASFRTDFEYGRWNGREIPSSITFDTFRQIRFSASAVARSGYSVAFGERKDDAVINLGAIDNSFGFIEMDDEDDISDAKLSRALHVSIEAKKAGEPFFEGGDFPKGTIVVGKTAPELFPFAFVVKAKDIVAKAKEWSRNHKQPRKSVSNGTPRKANAIGNRSVTMFIPQESGSFERMSITVDGLLKRADGREINFIDRKGKLYKEIEAALGNSYYNRRYGMLSSYIRVLPRDSVPAFAAIPSNVRNTEAYLSYTKGKFIDSAYVEAAFTNFVKDSDRKMDGALTRLLSIKGSEKILNVLASGSRVLEYMDADVRDFFERNSSIFERFERGSILPDRFATVLNVGERDAKPLALWNALDPSAWLSLDGVQEKTAVREYIGGFFKEYIFKKQ